MRIYLFHKFIANRCSFYDSVENIFLMQHIYALENKTAVDERRGRVTEMISRMEAKEHETIPI